MWKDLEDLFRTNKDAKAMAFDNELHNIKLGDFNIDPYFT